MSDESVEVTEQGWGSRIMESIKGILVGIVLFIASFPILFLNEGCAVKTRKGLQEVQKNTVSVSADESDPANDGKPIHFTAKATSTETLQDPAFTVKAQGIRLVRKVEMYQWHQESESKSRKEFGGKEKTKTRYTYSKVWSSELKDSSNYHEKETHKNPTEMDFKTETQTADVVTAGAFQLNPSLISKISGEKPIVPDEAVIRSLPEKLAGKAKLHNGVIYKGKNPDAPEIGDLRISFSILEPVEVTVVAKQKGKLLETYKTKGGFEFSELKMGNVGVEEFFAAEHSRNETRTWVFRIGGFLAMLIGIFLVLRPIAVLGDVIPFIGSLIGGALFLVAGLVSVGLSLITISIAWIFYRPLLGVPLFIAGVAALVMVIIRKKKAPAESHEGF